MFWVCEYCWPIHSLSGTWDICKANLSQYLQISILLLTKRICSISSMPKHRTMIGIRTGLRGWGLDLENWQAKVRIPTPKTKVPNPLFCMFYLYGGVGLLKVYSRNMKNIRFSIFRTNIYICICKPKINKIMNPGTRACVPDRHTSKKEFKQFQE
mgnify:CR=1 FL=1